MERHIVHQTELITLWCDPDAGLVQHEIHAYCHGPAIRAALNAGTAAMARYGCTRWLSDDRLNGPLSPEDAEWAMKEWFPRTQAAGWQR